MQLNDILAKIEGKFGKTDFRWCDDHTGDPFLLVPVDRLRQLAAFLKDDPGLSFDTLMSISGVHLVDEMETISLVYHLFSMRHRHRFIFKVPLERPITLPHFYLRVDTVSDIWAAAGWLEREIYDMFGVHFAGHRDFRRLLLPRDWHGHPLLKDYQEPDAYHHIRTSREDVSYADSPDEGRATPGTS